MKKTRGAEIGIEQGEEGEMGNVYSCEVLKVLYNRASFTRSHSHNHSCTEGKGCHARGQRTGAPCPVDDDRTGPSEPPGVEPGTLLGSTLPFTEADVI